MPEVQDYVNKLLELKKGDPVKYAETMKMYQDNYPEFYAKLAALMPKEEVAGVLKEELAVPIYSRRTRFRDFIREYWAYLIFIGAGLTVVTILLILLLSRLGQ